MKRIKATMNNITKGPCLFHQSMCESTIDFKAVVNNPVEEQKLKWTTFNNLNITQI